MCVLRNAVVLHDTRCSVVLAVFKASKTWLPYWYVTTVCARNHNNIDQSVT
jgi:hypothetical protein